MSDMASRELYRPTEVDRILGIRAGTTRRWVSGYERAGTRYPPVVREEGPGTELVTWSEFVEVFFLARFRDGAGIPMRTLRSTLDKVRERLEYHYIFAHDELLHADPERLEVIKEIQAEEGFPNFLVEMATGQLRLLDDARERLLRIEYHAGLATSLLPRDGIDSVRVFGGKFFGKPKIEGTGISPHAVAEPVFAGTPVAVVAELFGLSEDIVNDAGRFTYGDRWRAAA